MSDYQLRVRIPQETADRMFEVMNDLKEDEYLKGADITTSSITRAALEQFVKENRAEIIKIKVDNSEFAKEDINKIRILVKKLKSDDLTDGQKNIIDILLKGLIELEFIDFARRLKEHRK